MKQCSLLCAGIWPIILLPLLFMLPLLFFKWHAIEEDVANNTKLALASENLNWAQIKTVNRGRHVLITGTPPSFESVDEAERIARAAYGVDAVTVSADAIPPAKPASLNSSIIDGSLTLSGQLASQAEIDDIGARAIAVFGESKVQNRLTVGKNLAELPSLIGFFETLKNNASGSKPFVADIDNNTLSLKGIVASASLKRELNNSFSRLFRGRIDDQLTIAAPPVVKRDICLDSVNELLSQNNINFESSKAKIKADSFPLLDRIKQTAERCPDAQFEIDGHTDSQGNPAFNMSLSEKRAQAVIDHLTGLGLDTSQFSANGFGPNKPIADNSTPEGRAQNRRIEIRLKNQ